VTERWFRYFLTHDPDAQLLTEDQLAMMRRVPHAKTLRRARELAQDLAKCTVIRGPFGGRLASSISSADGAPG
jgi:hypothetical protein